MTQNQSPEPDTDARTRRTRRRRPRRSCTASARRPSALGVKPDARLQTAFLTQAFLWMFVGLLVTAGVAYVVQTNARLLEFAGGNFFLLFIAQLGDRVRHQPARSTGSARPPPSACSSSTPRRSGSRSG